MSIFPTELIEVLYFKPSDYRRLGKQIEYEPEGMSRKPGLDTVDIDVFPVTAYPALRHLSRNMRAARSRRLPRFFRGSRQATSRRTSASHLISGSCCWTLRRSAYLWAPRPECAICRYTIPRITTSSPTSKNLAVRRLPAGFEEKCSFVSTVSKTSVIPKPVYKVKPII